MAKKPVTKEIENKTFEFYPLSPRESLRLVTRLSKLLAEPFGLIMDSAGGKGKGGLIKNLFDGDIGSDVFGKAMRSLTERLDEKEVEDTCYMLLEKVHGQFEGDRGTRPLNIEVDFAGDFGLFMQVVFASAEVNFGSFLRGKLGGVITRSGQANTTQDMSPATATSIG